MTPPLQDPLAPAARVAPAAHPGVIQARASDPMTSVWVEASAGSGKTKVLTDRLLRLMLAGVAPSRILCLTFTRAAAAEMANRLQASVAALADLAADRRAARIAEICDHPADAAMVERGGRLLSDLLDAPGGLQIRTIHSFCQSLLRRFPREAGLAPQFRVLDEYQAGMLQREARDLVLAARDPADTDAADAAAWLAQEIDERSLGRAIAQITAQRERLLRVVDGVGGLDPALALIGQALATDGDVNAVEARMASIPNPQALGAIAEQMVVHGSPRDSARGEAMLRFLARDPVARMTAEALTQWQRAFLTEQGQPFASPVTKALAQRMPHATDLLQAEAARLVDLRAEIGRALTAQASRAALTLATRIVHRYQQLKRARVALDYEDLVAVTLRLLAQGGGAAWVQYRLDEGLDHLLIDEAQDTSPRQWEVALAIAENLMAVDRRHPLPRSLFVVGDRKQSIFSFQGADVAAFARVRHHLDRLATTHGRPLAEVPMDTSFRSAPAVLRLVDAVFAPADVHAGVTLQPPIHSAFHRDRPGEIEVWPVLQATAPRTDATGWTLPLQAVAATGAAARLNLALAARMRGWMDRGEVDPGDIMVLVRRREAMPGLVAACQRLGVPVAGVDRMQLGTELAVRDLLGAVRVALNPDDDLSLAAVLRGPLVGLEEPALEALAAGRGRLALAARLRDAAKTDAGLAPIETWLSRLRRLARGQPPYEVLQSLLDDPCPAAASGRRAVLARLGPACLDPVAELIAASLTFQLLQVPTLEAFVAWIDHSDQDIKRELEQVRGAVRILTAHAAKGLEARVVILPDTISLPPERDAWCWPLSDPGGGLGQIQADPGADSTPVPEEMAAKLQGLPLFRLRKQADTPLLRERREAARRRALEEYRRLLYVALTRARERLVIAGQCGRTPNAMCWHPLVADAANRLVQAVETDAGQVPDLEARQEEFDPTAELIAAGLSETEAQAVAWTGTVTILRDRLADAALGPPAAVGARPAAAGPVAAMAADPLPPWLHQPALGEEDAVVIGRRPSDGGPDGAAAAGALMSPLSPDQAFRFQRGLWMHRLLQTLPELPADGRAQAAAAWLEHVATRHTPAERQAMVDDVMRVLEDPEARFLFGPQSRAEVAVVGTVTVEDGRAVRISGQIDRLAILDDQIWIVDFKTNRNPPTTPDQVPAGYRRQLRCYRDLVRQIYPGHAVQCALLWTDNGTLMRLTDPMLEMRQSPT